MAGGSGKTSLLKKSASSILSCARGQGSPPPSPSTVPLNPQTPSSSSSSLPPPPPPPPSYCLCPITSSLMFDPVITITGHSYERNGIQACIDLGFFPPQLIPCSSPLILTPNLALKHTILHWCHHANHSPPSPISPEAATQLVSQLMSSAQSLPPLPPTSLSSTSQPETHEQRILNQLLQPSFSSKESGLAALITAPVCTNQILNALVTCLHNHLEDNLQTLAAKALFTLTIEPANRTMILYSGLVQHLLTALNTGSTHARAHATGAIYKLSIEEHNRIPVGSSLGAIRPLLKQFLSHSVGRKKAMLALYYLCLQQENLKVLVDIGGVEKLIEWVGEESSTGKMRRYALILLYLMVGTEGGREEVLERSGATYVKVLLQRVRETGDGVGLNCLMVMYRVCRESMKRFREVAVEAGVEEVLVVGGEDEEVVKKCWGEYGRGMARRMVRAIRGEISEREELQEIDMGIESVENDEDDEEAEEESDPKGKKKMMIL